MRQNVIQAFQKNYGYDPVFLVRAPGRANLIGEHTDYNDGFVMPLAVDRALWLAVAPRDDRNVRLHSLDFGGQTVEFSPLDIKDARLPHWSQHVRGVWWLLEKQGWFVPGADVVIGSNIPIGAGMSSSAAAGVGVVEMALALLNETASQSDKAMLAVDIEHQFIGTPSGIMDQMASAAALADSAMLLDCRSLEITPVVIPPSLRVVVMNTMKSRALADSEYGLRRQQCEQAAKILGVKALRDADARMVVKAKAQLGDLLYRRAWHVVTENARTLSMKDALAGSKVDMAGEIIKESHTSLRYDYEVSCLELDIMSDLASDHPACYGARMMGGGFGGSAIGLVDTTRVDEFLAYLAPLYSAQTGLTPEFYVCQPAPGSGLEWL